MSRSKLTVLVRSLTLLASVGAPCLANAADLLPPPPPMPAPPPPVEVGGGWYLRGDVGVGATEIGGLRTTVDNITLPSGYEIASASFGDSYFAGAGIGYQFNSFIRGDVTAEYRGFGDFRFVERFDLPDGSGNRNGIDANSGKFRSIVLMANGYFDLGTWFCLTPYVGGGVGTAFHQVSGFIDQGAAGAAGGFGYAKTKETNSLAWNLQAGVTYDVTPNFKVDVGYRYMNLGSAKTAVVDCLGNDCPGAHYKFADITSHDVKIGVRYLLGGAVASMPALAPDYAPGPVVRKY